MRTPARFAFVATLVVGVLLGAGTADAGSAPSADYAAAVTTVQMRSAELEELLAETRDRVAQLEETLRVQGQSESQRFESVEAVNTELAALRGRVEVLEFKFAEVDAALDAMLVSNERRLLWSESRLRQVEGLLGVKPPPPPTDADLGITGSAALAPVPAPGGSIPVAGAVPAPESTDAPVPKDASGRLDLAIEHMRAGRQVAARAVLKQAIDENAGAPEMDEIRYRYAETFFNTGDFSKAVTDFQSVITNHPKSDWACWSYFRQGESLEKWGKASQSKSFYQGATEGSCSKSAAAKEARKKL